MEICSDPLCLNKARSFGANAPAGREGLRCKGARSESLHAQPYGAAVDLGKVNVERNPTSGTKVVRRRVLRASNGVVQPGLRRVGLWR